MNDDQIDGLMQRLSREAHQFAEMTDKELEQLGKDEGSMPSIPLVEKKDVDDIYAKELDDYAGFEPENELRDARTEMENQKRFLDVGDMGSDITDPETSFPYQEGGEQTTEDNQYDDMEPEMDINWSRDPQEQEEIDEGGAGSGPQGGTAGGVDSDFYEAGMMQPSTSGKNTMYRDMSDVKSSGQDTYLDMAQKDYDDPTYALSNKDYEDVYDKGGIRESANEMFKCPDCEKEYNMTPQGEDDLEEHMERVHQRGRK